MSEHDLVTLRNFQQVYGRTWKARLRECWINSSYPGMTPYDASVLQSLRNREDFGPKGLCSVKL